MYKILLKKSSFFIFPCSFSSQIDTETIILQNGNKAQINESKKTLSTIRCIYKEKNVSAHNPQPSINRNNERDVTLTEIGIEKKFFFKTEKSQLLTS